MEDRYLFKAKRVDDGEWVRGNLIYTFTGIPCIVTEYDHIMNFININEVDPTTICQCTGLKDRNGKLIWENDILSGHLDEDYPEDETREHILWRENGWHTKELGSIDYAPLDDFDSENFEVIGNIFDNKDLLESEK